MNFVQLPLSVIKNTVDERRKFNFLTHKTCFFYINTVNFHTLKVESLSRTLGLRQLVLEHNGNAERL